MTYDEQTIDRIREAIARGDAVFICGTGVSRAALTGKPEESLMSWPGLLSNGIDYVRNVRDTAEAECKRWRDKLQQSDTFLLIGVGGWVANNLNYPNPPFSSWLRAVFEPIRSLIRPNDPLLAALRRLWKAGARIATTNYDDILAQFLGVAHVVPKTNFDGATRWLSSNDCVVHLHGHYTEPSSVVLGLQGYQSLSRDQVYTGFLNAIAATQTLVFLGTGAGLEDPNMHALLWKLSEFTAASTNRLWYILAREEDAGDLKAKFADYGAAVITYGTEHHQLASWLERLADETQEEDSSLVESAQSLPMNYPGGPAATATLGGGTFDQFLPELSEKLRSILSAPSGRVKETIEKTIVWDATSYSVSEARRLDAWADGVLAPPSGPKAEAPSLRGAVLTPYAETITEPAGGQMISGPLISEDLQRAFVVLTQHEKFLEGFDPDRSYCFRAVEKVGKGSFLGFLARTLLQRGGYLPLWLNELRETNVPPEVELAKAIAAVAGHHGALKPVVLIDDIYKHPRALEAVLRMPDLVVYCTTLTERPDGTDGVLWDAVQGRRAEIEARFGDGLHYRTPSHPVVWDGDEMTEDGRRLRAKVAADAGEAAAVLLDPVMMDPINHGTLPILFFSLYVQENRGKTAEERHRWITERRANVTPQALYRKSWDGTDLHRDVIRAAAFLEHSTPDLLARVVARYRGDAQDKLAAYIEEQRDLGRLIGYEESFPYRDVRVVTMSMLDGLRLTALDPLNLSPATVRRLVEALVAEISPADLHGELAAILVHGIAPDEPWIRLAAWKQMARQTWNDAGCAYLQVAVEMMDATMESRSTIHRLATALAQARPARLRISWANVIVRALAKFGAVLSEELRAKVLEARRRALEEEWEHGDGWRDAGLARMADLASAKDWIAVRWWVAQLEQRKASLDTSALLVKLVALRATGDAEVADAMVADRAASEPLLIAAVRERMGAQEWEQALAASERLATLQDAAPSSVEYGKAVAVRSLLSLRRDDDAQKRIEAADASPLVLLTAVRFYVDNERCEPALVLLDRLATNVDENVAADARILRVLALLGLGRDEEVAAMTGPPDAEFDVLASVATHYDSAKEWERALPIHQTIRSRFPDKAIAAESHEVRSLIQLNRIDEAMQIVAATTSPVVLNSAGTAAAETGQWEVELVIDERLERMESPFDESAGIRIVDSLVALGRHDALSERLRSEDVSLNWLSAAALAYEKREDWEHSLTYHRRMKRAPAFRLTAMLYEAIALFRMDRHNEALAVVQQLADGDLPNDLLVGGINALLKSKCYPLTVPLIERSRVELPDDPILCRLEALAWIALGREAEAQEALARTPVTPYVMADVAAAYSLASQWARSVEWFERLFAANPDMRREAMATYVRAGLRAGRSYETLLGPNEDALTADAVMEAVVFFHERGDLSRLADAYGLLAIYAPSSDRTEILARQAVALIDAKRPEDADSLLASDALDVEVLQRAALRFEVRGEWSRALALHERIGSFTDLGRAATVHMLRPLLELGREGEALMLAQTHDLLDSLMVAEQEFHEAHQNWAEARVVSAKLASVRPDDAGARIATIKLAVADGDWAAVDSDVADLRQRLSALPDDDNLRLSRVRWSCWADLVAGNPAPTLEIVKPRLAEFLNEPVPERALEAVLVAALAAGDDTTGREMLDRMSSVDERPSDWKRLPDFVGNLLARYEVTASPELLMRLSEVAR